MTIRMCKCEVRELRKDEQLCPACAEAQAAFWKKTTAVVGSVALSLVLFVVSRGAIKPNV